MKKFYSLPLFLSIFASFPIAAKSLTPEEAFARIENQLPKTRGQEETGSYRHVYTLSSSGNTPSLYVFNKDEGDGFMVLSADDAAPAILGYSDHGSFNPSNIPPELKYWLSVYGDQIACLNGNRTMSLSAQGNNPLPGATAIAPLLKTKWNQGAPYNKYCFTIATDGTETQSVTGCVATSMAQVMYYFQYPDVGHGEISYKFDDSGTYSMNFGDQKFEWSEMLPTYYPDSYDATEGDAVAYLMKACGYSVRMDYGKGESGASGTAIAGALTDYFGYSEAVNIQTRKFYTYTEWAQMIYENLSKVGPVVYNGSALDGGHSFVCDGYDGNGYFHFNWGWGGMSDGYYLLDALNPDEFGIGGAAGGYNLGQQIILGISPDASANINRQVMQFGSVNGKIEGNILTLSLVDAQDAGFQYIDPEPISITFGVMVRNIDNTSQEVQYFESNKKNLEGKEGSYYHWDEVGTTIDLSKVNMTEGDEYDFVLSTYITAGNSSAWTESCPMPGKYNYVTITKTTNGFELTNYPVETLSVSDFSVITSPVYYDMPVKFSATFSNSGSVALTRNYSAVLFDSAGKECYKMENYSVNIDAGTSQSIDWTSVEWYKEDGVGDVTEATDYTLKLYDNWEGAYVDGVEETITVLPKPANSAKIESQLTIVGAQKEGDEYVLDSNEFEATLQVKVLEGSLNHTLMLAIQMPLSSGDYYTVFHKHFDGIPDMSAGEEQTFDISVIFEGAQPDTKYRVEVWGPDGGFNEVVYLRFDIKDGSVFSLKADKDGLYKVYSIDGREVYSGKEISVIESLTPGLYIINGHKFLLR